PALSSQELITCDNTEFSAALLAKGQNAARQGIVYSVPFYGPDGKFKGLVSAVLRTWMIGRMFEQPFFGLAHPSANYFVTPMDFAHDLRGAVADMSVGKPPAGFAYSSSQPCSVKDATPWVLTCAVPQRIFEETDAAVAARSRGSIVLAAGSIVSILLASI